MNHPFGVDVGLDGNVYVADQNNHRIQKFHPDGTLISEWGSFGTDPGQMEFPSGIAVSPSGDVYTVENHSHRISHFTSTGAFVAIIGGPGIFFYPVAIAIDAAGMLYVADTE